MSQNWCSGDSRTLAQSRLWLLETMVRFPEPCRKPSVPGTFPEPWRPGTQKVARTHCSQNLAWKSGLRNLGFLEPCPEPWFPEPWVPGTLPRTLVPEPVLGTLVPGTSETRRQGRAVPRSTPKAMWAETPKHSAVGEKTPRHLRCGRIYWKTMKVNNFCRFIVQSSFLHSLGRTRRKPVFEPF